MDPKQSLGPLHPAHRTISSPHSPSTGLKKLGRSKQNISSLPKSNCRAVVSQLEMEVNSHLLMCCDPINNIVAPQLSYSLAQIELLLSKPISGSGKQKHGLHMQYLCGVLFGEGHTLACHIYFCLGQTHHWHATSRSLAKREHGLLTKKCSSLLF